MAKYRRGKKLQPAVQNLWFSLPSWDGVDVPSASHYIDLSQVASLANRRAYRQGVQWAVSSISIHFPELAAGESIATRPSITISKLPNTWVMSNAWEKAFRAWQRMNNEALSESESVKPKFLDFKVYADSVHHGKGFVGNLLPYSEAGLYVAGEWESSKIIQPKTDGTDDVQEREIIATGSNYPGASPVTGHNAVSLIEGYAASRGLPNITDPNVPDDAASANDNIPQNWLASMFNQGTDQTEAVLQDMITENNLAPYPFENDGIHTDTMYPGGSNQGTGLEIHDYKAFTATTLSNTLNFDGGIFPCGLIKIFNQIRYEAGGETIAKPAVLKVTLVPGEHRGYMCEPMTEM